MANKISRTRFITVVTGSLPFILFGNKVLAHPLNGDLPQKADPLDPKGVQDFVRISHFDFEGVKAKLAEQPALLNATTDWGRGDFETATGAASHMGRKDIVTFLISKGARIDIFTAAMMGYTDLVISLCTRHPELLQSSGPHGITLLTHAHKGGEEAKPVVEYLAKMGITK